MSSTTPPPTTTTTTSSRARAYLPFCSSIKIIFLFGVGCCCVLVRQLILSSNRYSTYHNVNEMFSFEAPPIITQAFDLKQQGDGSHEDDTKKQFTNKILHTKKIRTTTLELKRATTVQTKEHHEPLNVIIFYPDDMRYDSLQDVRGQELVKTPFLTELAKQGMRFTHNAVTTSICWVSRATLFTGQYSSQHGAEKLYCPRFTLRNYWKWTWPNLLKEKAGYFTGHVGKWQYRNSRIAMRRLFDWTACFEGQHWHGSESSTDMAIDNAKRFLQEKRPKDKPFALTVALYSPKAVGDSKVPGAQWQPMNHTRRLYDNITYERPYDVKQAYRSLPGFLQRGIWRGRYDQRWHSEEQFQESMKNYHALITQVDDACRQITDIIKSQGLWNKTMVIFTSDNGLLTGAHGLAGKWNPFEESIRVPLIIYDPRMPLEKRGTIDDSFTLNIDLAETILGAAGVTPSQVMQGRDITDLYLRRNTAPWRDEFYYEFPEFIDSGIPASEALVRKKYKYINYPKRDKTGNDYEQLFDLENDPFELVDLIHKKKRDTDATEGSSPSVAVERVLQEMQQRLKVLRDKMTEPNKPRPSDWCNDTIGWKVNQTYPI